MSPAGHRTEVTLEVAPRRAFASAVDWPGWCRSGRTPDDALRELAAYADRYAAVAALAGVELPAGAGDGLTVVDQVPGSATTEFGAPAAPAGTDARELTAADADRQVRLLRAAWTELDRLATEAPALLRKGPRGGGRDRDAVVAHVLEAERSYARTIGVRHPPFHGDPDAVTACRAGIEHVLRAGAAGAPGAGGARWTPRQFLRRAAWHVLDHVWEVEDRSEPGPGGPG